MVDVLKNTKEDRKMETKLYILIKELFEEIKAMTPEDGFSSPRDLHLVKEVNQKEAILENLQKAMRVINPDFEIRI
jgi:hypothetical protein